MTKNLIETVLISNKDYKALLQERDELKKTVENQKLEYEELQCDYNELEQRHNEAFEQFKEMRARHNELLASCEQSEQEAAEIVDELKQENKELKEYKTEHKYSNAEYRQERESVIQLSYYKNKYRSALEEIRNICNKCAGVYTNAKVVGLINEVLNVKY